MARQVPLGRRNALADRRRLAATALVVGLAVMLILILDGLWAGVRSQATRYSDRAGADLFVVPPDSRLLFSDYVTIPRSTARRVAAVEGVRWAEPVRGQYAVLQLHGRKVVVNLVGSVPGHPGGPWSLADGRRVRRDDEIVVDRVVAERHDLDVGSDIDVLGRRFHVVGLAADSATFMTGFAFVTHLATDELLRSPGTTSAVLVRTDAPTEVARTLRRDGLNVLTRDEVRQEQLSFATRVYGTPMRLMVLVAFIGGTLVVALTAYTAIAERRREYGIVKAIGATGWRLVRLALAQTAIIAGTGLVGGAILFVAGRAVITAVRPQFEIVLTTQTLGRSLAATVAMAAIAAVVPARRLNRLDPATAYRSS